MNEAKPVDRRTKKTKRAIRNALAKLLSEKDLNEITVRELADLAEINRKTFYRYYAGIYQVVDEIENEIVSVYGTVLGEVDFFNRDSQGPYRNFERLTAIINTDLDFYGNLLSMRGNVSLVSKIAAMMKAKTKETLLSKIDLDEAMFDVFLEYTFTGMVAVYHQWFNSGRRQPIEEIADIISVMAYHGFMGVLNLYKETGEKGK